VRTKNLIKSAFLFASILSTVCSFSQSAFPVPEGNVTVFKNRDATISIQGNGDPNYANTSILELNTYRGRQGGSPTKILGIDDMTYSAHLAFFTASPTWDLVGLPAKERMRITSSGAVGIGDFTNPDPTLQPKGMLHLKSIYGNSDLYLESTDGSIWDIVSNNGGLFSLYQKTTGQTRFAISSNGNVGIGTISPQTLFHVQGKGSFGDKVTLANAKRALNLVSTDAVMRIVRVDPTKTNAPAVELISRNTEAEGSDNAYWDFYAEPTNASFNIRDRKGAGSTGGVNMLSIAQGTGNIGIIGNVGIGTTNINDNNYKLFVEKGIRTRKVKVDQDNWPDYVFSNSYKLSSLLDVEKFIKENKHLPDVPSAEKVEKEGVDIGSTQAILLRKIEELTLYLIEQDKKNQKLQQRIEQLESKQ
jgi:hypothetical protein